MDNFFESYQSKDIITSLISLSALLVSWRAYIRAKKADSESAQKDLLERLHDARRMRKKLPKYPECPLVVDPLLYRIKDNYEEFFREINTYWPTNAHALRKVLGSTSETYKYLERVSSHAMDFAFQKDGDKGRMGSIRKFVREFPHVSKQFEKAIKALEKSTGEKP